MIVYFGLIHETSIRLTKLEVVSINNNKHHRLLPCMYASTSKFIQASLAATNARQDNNPMPWAPAQAEVDTQKRLAKPNSVHE